MVCLDTTFLVDLVRARPEAEKKLLHYGRLTNELKAKGSPIGDLDTLVASTALVHRQILLTRDKAHFEKVPGLVVESW